MKNKLDLIPFTECFTIYPTSSFSRDKLTNDVGNIKNIHYGDIHTFSPVVTNVNNEKLPYLKSDINTSRIKPESFCRDGDVIMADTAEDYAGVGKAIEVTGIGNQQVTGGLHTYLCRDENHLFADGFRGYMLNSPFVHNQIMKYAAGMKVYSITKANLAKILLPLPPLEEQKRIASTLSAVDKAIEQAGIAIEESERMKRGLMQKLLNGDLESISKKYEMKPFSDCFTMYQTNSFSRDKLTYDNGHTINIHYGDIHKQLPVITDIRSEKLPYLKEDIDSSRIKPESFCRDGDIIMADTAEDYDGVGKSIELTGIDNYRVVGGLHTYLCRDESHIFQNGFRGYLLNSPFVHNQIMKYAAGMKVYSITKSNLSKILLPCPSSQEQQNITKIFSSVDKIIGQNKHRKSLLETLKRGMMQQLLAGAK